MTPNGSYASLPADDAPFGCEAKVAQPWETDQFYQSTLQNSFGYLLRYENLGQDSKKSLEFLSNWVTEDQDDHTYTDAANPNTSYPTNQLPETHVQQGSTNFCKSNGQKNFVRKLFDMLSDATAKDYIYWNQDGKSFVIENPEQFAKKVLKRYLKNENFQSFIRQLNMYDFHKINRAQRAQRGVQAQATQYVFSHTKFRRDEPELLSEIRRKGAEPQDAPPQYDSVFAANKFGIGLAPTAPVFPTAQPDWQVGVLKAEIQRLNEELAQRRAAYRKLESENQSLKAGFQGPTIVSMPQVQAMPCYSVTSYTTIHGGNVSNPTLDRSRSVALFERDYSASNQAKVPVHFQQATVITDRSSNNQAASTSCVSLDPTVPQIRRRLSKAQAPDMSTNPQLPPQQPQTKSRPTSWCESLFSYIPGLGSHGEPGPSTPANNFHQDAYASRNTTNGKGKAVGGTRAQPVSTFVQARAKIPQSARETPSPPGSAMLGGSDKEMEMLADRIDRIQMNR
ncbi:hypothetical protein FRC01_001016 [Tulasnella sp. 417]|nr:hypothetical protein FRC01_001016 [Tulasnella sp. 417]